MKKFLLILLCISLCGSFYVAANESGESYTPKIVIVIVDDSVSDKMTFVTELCPNAKFVQDLSFMSAIEVEFPTHEEALEAVAILNANEKVINASYDYKSTGGIEKPLPTLPPRPDIIVQMDGVTLTFDVDPITDNDRVLVPFRAIFEAFGAEVSWDGATETVTATTADTTLSLTIGKPEITVNGEKVELDVAPQLVNDRTLVPIRAVSEGLGAKVEWDESNRQVIITTE